MRELGGVSIHQQRLIHMNTVEMKNHFFLADYSIEPDDYIDPRLRLHGGKPPIYALLPEPIEHLQVSVELCPQWKFSVLYPLPDKRGIYRYLHTDEQVHTQASREPCPDEGLVQAVAWEVACNDSGMMFYRPLEFDAKTSNLHSVILRAINRQRIG